MEMHVWVGADKEGRIRGIDLHTLSNTGAFGEHGPTTVGLSGHKSIPLYGRTDAFRFTYDVVYTLSLIHIYMMNGQLKPAYNVQIAVENYFIIHGYVSNDRTDYNTLIPVLEKHRNAFGDTLEAVTADLSLIHI